MCRLAFYLGPEISVSALAVEPEHSIIHQSTHARERIEPLNGDGFGIGWYEHELQSQPVLFKEVTPAWNSLNLTSLAPVARSTCILAHVRAASSGLSVGQLNCHPFGRGRFSFMHNGEVAGFLSIKRRLLAELSDDAFSAIQGSTDTEALFALLMDSPHMKAPDAGMDQMVAAMQQAVDRVETLAEESGSQQPSHLNLVLSDGKQAVICRYATPGFDTAQSLYLHQGGRYHCENGQCSMQAHDDPSNTDRQTVIIASEPLSDEPGWSSVPLNHFILVDQNHAVSITPMDTTARQRRA